MAVLKNLATLLSPTGVLVFDSRNPTDQDWLTWTPEASYELLSHPIYGDVALWNDYAWQGDVLHYQSFYQRLDTAQLYQASSAITFPTWLDIQAALSAAGLAVKTCWGDWQQQVFIAEASPEIVVVAGLVNGTVV